MLDKIQTVAVPCSHHQYTVWQIRPLGQTEVAAEIWPIVQSDMGYECTIITNQRLLFVRVFGGDRQKAAPQTHRAVDVQTASICAPVGQCRFHLLQTMGMDGFVVVVKYAEDCAHEAVLQCFSKL